MWLAPTQLKLLPIADRHFDRAFEIKKQLEMLGMRVEVDDRNEKIGYKIREAQLEKIPYTAIIGDKELEEGTLSVRRRSEGDIGSMKLEEFIALAKEEIETRLIRK